MKRNFKNPKLEDLVSGNVLSIYQDFKEENNYEGKAVLIRREYANLEELPYIRMEIGGTSKQDAHTINWSYQRWLVEFVEGPNKGFRTHRYIAYYLSTKSNIKSQYVLDPFENMSEEEYEEYMDNQDLWNEAHFDDEE